MKHKSFHGGLVKADESTGEVVAIFSRFNVIDYDGDVTVPGAFEEGAAMAVSAYNHGSSKGQHLPVGRGVIRQTDEVAEAHMKFFLKTTHGRDAFETVKEMGEIGEWSYNYDVLAEEPGQHSGMRANFLKALKVHEVSPVLVGAGIGTQTVSVKSLKDLTDDELAEEAERAFKALHERGLAIPETLAAAVHAHDALVAAEAEMKRRKDGLRVEAALRGIQYEGAA